MVSRERSQRKPRTSKFLMVGKLDFNFFHAYCFDFLIWMLELWYLRLNHDDLDINGERNELG